MAVVVSKNGREDELFGFALGFCTDGNFGARSYAADPLFDEWTFPATTAGADVPSVKLQQLVAAPNCLVSMVGLTTGDTLVLPLAGGGTTSVPMNVGGVVVKVASADPVFTTLVFVAVDATLCNNNGYWTTGAGNSQIAFPGSVLLYHELIGHALHHCDGTFNVVDPEGQAIADENVLRALQGLETRTSHNGGCGGGTNGCFIATAAYGPTFGSRVDELRRFRDQVVRATPWGEAFFNDWWTYYFAQSPRIADQIREDARFADLVRSVHVEPMLIAFRLFESLPDDPDDADDAIAFANRAMGWYEDWIRGLPLHALPQGADAIAITDGLIQAMSILPSARLRAAALDALGQAGILPIVADSVTRAESRARLEAAGMTEDEIARCLGERFGG